MIHLCPKCGKLIEDGELIEMTVNGRYRRIDSPNAFRLDKDLTFKTGTLQHVDCGDFYEDD